MSEHRLATAPLDPLPTDEIPKVRPVFYKHGISDPEVRYCCPFCFVGGFSSSCTPSTGCGQCLEGAELFLPRGSDVTVEDQRKAFRAILLSKHTACCKEYNKRGKLVAITSRGIQIKKF